MFKTKLKKAFSWIKKHVRPDVGITPFEDGCSPDLKTDNLYEVSDKLKENLKVGLKITWKF